MPSLPKDAAPIPLGPFPQFVALPETPPDCPAELAIGIGCRLAYPHDRSRWCPACPDEEDFEDLIGEFDPDACDCRDPACPGCDDPDVDFEGGGS